MTRAQALDLVNTVDSRHQAAQKVLRKFVRGEEVSNEELDQLPSPFAPVVAILKSIRDGVVVPHAIIEELDTFSEPLKPLLFAMVDGFQV